VAKVTKVTKVKNIFIHFLAKLDHSETNDHLKIFDFFLGVIFWIFGPKMVQKLPKNGPEIQKMTPKKNQKKFYSFSRLIMAFYMQKK